MNEDLTMNFVLEEESLYTVSGNITPGNSKYYGSGQPLAGAVVTAGEATATTDETGAYTLSVPAGGYVVTATYPGSIVSE
ncbi:MAG: carboxypeptidase regulatory-like domain-containing protein, partial [Abditibacteriota bacterium]|nr:carboxypeptidase regulatory-like domain-containing protein [Abditibacteriota bacterium]